VTDKPLDPGALAAYAAVAGTGRLTVGAIAGTYRPIGVGSTTSPLSATSRPRK